jgi:hypothetical protein
LKRGGQRRDRGCGLEEWRRTRLCARAVTRNRLNLGRRLVSTFTSDARGPARNEVAIGWVMGPKQLADCPRGSGSPRRRADNRPTQVAVTVAAKQLSWTFNSHPGSGSGASHPGSMKQAVQLSDSRQGQAAQLRPSTREARRADVSAARPKVDHCADAAAALPSGWRRAHKSELLVDRRSNAEVSTIPGR